ncbi:hypothetical protein F4774DRAFT_394992 [Daldinia eschscholtzii]|nr:hypothetical protein F4774DRAFT_394992 [Daldinia eschscholtzii]
MSNLGPLTTAYQPHGTGCHSIHVGITLDVTFLQHGTTSGCLPPGFQRYDGFYYSPGICPQGYTYACTAGVAVGTSSATAATCCPSSYSCRPRPSDDPNACHSFLASPTTYFVDVLSYSGDFITNLGTTSTYVNNGSEALAKGLVVWRASNDAKWSMSTTSTASSIITVENTLRTTPDIPTMTSDAPIPTTQMTHRPDSLSTGAKVGIGIGVSFGVLFFIGAVLAAYMIGRQKNRRMGKLPLLSTDIIERKDESMIRHDQLNEYKGMVEMSAVREPVEIMST